MPDVEREARYCRMKSLIALKDDKEALTDMQYLQNDANNAFGAEASFLLAEYYYNHNQLDKSEEAIMAFINKKSPYQYWIARSFCIVGRYIHRPQRRLPSQTVLADAQRQLQSQRRHSTNDQQTTCRYKHPLQKNGILRHKTLYLTIH